MYENEKKIIDLRQPAVPALHDGARPLSNPVCEHRQNERGN